MANPTVHTETLHHLLAEVQATKVLFRSSKCSLAEYTMTLVKFNEYLTDRSKPLKANESA